MENVVAQEAELNKPADSQPKDPEQLALLEEMMKAGLFLGRQSSKTHPKMKNFVFGVRNRSTIIDLEETLARLEEALQFVKKVISEKGTMLLVGTTPSVKSVTEATAKKIRFPYVTERWLGGTLTNFKTISKRIAHFKKLKSDKETGRLDKYTKKERLNFDREIAKLTTMFSGLEELDNVPNALFLADVNAHLTAVREANRLHIPVIAVINTDANPEMVQYPIPANDRSKMSIEWIMSRLERAVEEGRAQVKAAGEKVEQK